MNLKFVASMISVAVANCLRPTYLSYIAHATGDWYWREQSHPLKRVSLMSLISEQQEVGFLLCPQIVGEAPMSDFIALSTLVRMHQPQTLFEFGTFRGHSTVNMIMNAPPSAKIFTLDIPPQDRKELTDAKWDQSIDDGLIGQVYKQSPYSAQITQILEDSRKFDTTQFRESMDFIFVDAAHEYDFVVNDSAKAFEMLSDNGIVAWHDYSAVKPDVQKYLHDLAQKRDVFWIEGTQIAFCRGRDSEKTQICKNELIATDK